MVTNEQLYLAIGIPMIMYFTTTGLLMAYINAKFAAVNERFRAQDSKIDAQSVRIEAQIEAQSARIDAQSARIEAQSAKIDAQSVKIDALRETWRSELRRVEEVLDARLKHLETR